MSDTNSRPATFVCRLEYCISVDICPNHFLFNWVAVLGSGCEKLTGGQCEEFELHLGIRKDVQALACVNKLLEQCSRTRLLANSGLLV